MPAKKSPVDHPGGTIPDAYCELEERVFKHYTETPTDTQPGHTMIAAALAERDTKLLRTIAAERKGLTDPQRRALLLIADLLDGAAPPRRAAHA